MLKKTNQKGFTIIEVLIVLAIAGLILLVVFLAVPALQRNSRNTQRKNDIQNMLGAVQEYISNNQGAVPKDQATLDTALNNSKYGYYQPDSSGHVATYKSGATTNPNTTAGDDSVYIVFGATCSGSDAVASSARSIAVLYQLDTAGGSPSPQCQAS